MTYGDRIIIEIDTLVRTVFTPQRRRCERINPATQQPESTLTSAEKRHIAGLMRVNHAGEVCAQALYQGQAFTARELTVQQHMQKAAQEEIDHLAWCEERLHELHSKPSVLNGIWYLGSFFIGAIAGIAGDRWSLGFVAETERQVTRHLQKHIERLPSQDIKTKAILRQMELDETQHADIACSAGAAPLPDWIKHIMRLSSTLLTRWSYYI